MRCAGSALVCGALVVGAAPSASAERPDTLGRAAFIGADLRTDLGTHWGRVSGAVRIGCTWASVVGDPIGLATGTQHDTDVFVERELGTSRYAVLAGARFESVPILGVRYHAEKAIVGISAEVPYHVFDRVRFRFAAEVAVAVVQHGEGLPTLWAWDIEEPLRDAVDSGMFLRVEYGFGGGR